MRIILIRDTDYIVPTVQPIPDQTQRPAPTLQASTPIPSEVLFAPGRREVVIQHGDEQYRLRQTRNGKLILTK